MALLAIGSMSIIPEECMTESKETESDKAETEPFLLKHTPFTAKPCEYEEVEAKKEVQAPKFQDFSLVAGGLGLGMLANKVRQHTEKTDEWLVDEFGAAATFIASFMILLSMFASSYNQLPVAMFATTLIFCTSLNYWRAPTDGFRRRMDITCVGAIFLTQLFLLLPMAPPRARVAYLAVAFTGIGSYFLGRRFSFTAEGEEPNHLTGTVCHILLHFFANVGNIILYDSIGAGLLSTLIGF